jgi:hypothetical protein
MTVKQNQPVSRGCEVYLDSLICVDHNYVLPHTRGRFSIDAYHLESIAMRMQWMGVAAPIFKDQPIPSTGLQYSAVGPGVALPINPRASSPDSRSSNQSTLHQKPSADTLEPIPLSARDRLPSAAPPPSPGMRLAGDPILLSAAR